MLHRNTLDMTATRPHYPHPIRRVDAPLKYDHAWVVEARRRNEATIRRFSDSRYGGKRAALVAAIRFRDTVLTEAQGKNYRLWRRHRKRRDNTSGTIGIGRYVSRKRVNGRIYRHTAWQAFWCDQGWQTPRAPVLGRAVRRGPRPSTRATRPRAGHPNPARRARPDARAITCG